MTWQETIGFMARCMPKAVGKQLYALPEGSLRELRVRAGGKVWLMTAGGDKVCPGEVTQQQVAQIAEALCEQALYARAEEQRSGFVTLRGGHRMGLCGRVIAQGQSVRALREISSLCVRVAGQWRGAADKLLPHIRDAQGKPLSVLIIGLPGMGKTTMLRDALRSVSDDGVHVCIVDERSEIAAMCGGLPQLEVGANTDVLDGCCKEVGLRWMLRAMSPQLLATDELGGAMDAQAVLDAVRCGVSVMTTIHGRDLDTALSRGALYHLVQNQAFDRYAVLDEKEVGKLSALYDREMKPITMEAGA